MVYFNTSVNDLEEAKDCALTRFADGTKLGEVIREEAEEKVNITLYA